MNGSAPLAVARLFAINITPKSLNSHKHKYSKHPTFLKCYQILNYYPDEENYTAEQPSDSNFLMKIFPNYNQTNSYQTYNQTNSYQTYDQTNSYPTYDRTNSYPTYDRTKSYQTYDQTNSYPICDQTNLYLYSAICSNNIIYQQPNPAVPLYNFFGGSSSSTYGCNLAK
jgi:hypothetical protein